MQDIKFTVKEAADYLGVSERTLANWRFANVGPVFYKPSDKIYYFKTDIDTWIKESGKNNERV